MRKKLIAYSFLPVLGLGIFGVNFASAYGIFGGFGNIAPDEVATRQQNLFQEQATILGLNIDDVKNAWADGKSIKQLMEEKGIAKEQVAAKTKELKLQQLKTQLNALVAKGVITQAQADKRLQVMQSQIENSKGRKGMKMGRWFK